MDAVFKNIGLLATPQGKAAKKGAMQGQIRLSEKAHIGVENGKIVCVGEGPPPRAAQEIDCEGLLVTPGLVDAHTHLIFGGWRQKEMARKLAGETYLDILKSGGGILETVRQTRAESEQALYEKGAKLLGQMLSFGTTTAECKSGYGLTVEDELKQLRVARRLAEKGPWELVSTFMGAHAIPSEYKENRRAFIDMVCGEMIPAVKTEGLAEFCDIFCETAVFTPDESLEILACAAKHGMAGKAHADEITCIGGAEMAAAAGCVSAEHLIQASDGGIRALAEKGAVACLLPATSFCLDKNYARARDMVSASLAVAVCTDFNPGSSPNLNLQLPMYLSCLKYRLTPAEALTAVTLNAAAAVRRAEGIGSIEEGKQADLVVWDAPDLEYIFYRYGGNLVKSVFKKGERVA